MKFISTTVNGISTNLLVSMQGYEIRMTGHPDQLLTPENARLLANTLLELVDQIEDEKAFDKKCAAILSALTPTQQKLLAEKLATVKEQS